MKNNEHLHDKSKNITPEKTITKTNDLLRACYRLSLIEQRLILCCIAQIDSRKSYFNQPNKGSNHFYRVTAKDYAELFDLELKNVYTELKNAMNKLWERSVFTKDKEWNMRYRWVGSVKWNDEISAVELSFSHEIEPYLMGLHKNLRFTSYNMKNITQLKSTYSIRIFELFMQFKSTGMLDITIDEFKKLLDIEDKYKQFSDMKKRIIDVSVNELEEKNNMTISYEVKKQGRKLHRIVFKFEENKQQKLL